MNRIICPISNEKMNENSARISASLTILLSLLFIFTENVLFPIVLMIEFYMRAFTSWSIFGKISNIIVSAFNISNKVIDKAPKIFAARIGLLFSATSILISFFNMMAALTVMAILAIFAFLEAAFNICVGCLTYSFIILPLYNKEKGLS